MILKYFTQKYSLITKYYSNLYIFSIFPKVLNISTGISNSVQYLKANSEFKLSSSLSCEGKKCSPESTDPIIKKYKKMIDDIPQNKDKEKKIKEFIYTTDFGHIRFDSRTDILSVTNDSVEDKTYNHNRDKTDSENLNYIDEIYFKDSLSNIYPENCESVPVTRCMKKHKFEELSTPDLSYVDAQHVGGNLNKIKESCVDNSVTGIDSNLNYIDSQYFGQTDPAKDNKIKEVTDSRSVNNSRQEHVIFGSTSENISTNSDAYQKLIDENIYSFEESLLESLDDDSPKFNAEKTIIKKKLSRDTLEKELIELADRESHNLLSHNPRVLNKNESGLKSEKGEIEHHSINSGELSETNKNENTKDEDPMAIGKKIKAVESAYDFVKEKRKEELKSTIKQLGSEILPHEKYKKILLNVPRYSDITQYEMVASLKKSIIYNKNDIVALFKPYGVQMHNGGGNKHRWDIVGLLPPLAEAIKEQELVPVHRLDMNTTGILLLAKTEEMAAKLKKMFKENAVKKTYLAITKGIPNPLNGIIDIPIGEGKVDRYERSVLRPDVPGLRARNGRAKKAITTYKVLSSANGCSLLELSPVTGVKHQLRVHLGFGLGCPVLGDHKYSYLTKMAPQKLPGDALDMLGLKQSAVRHLPLHLHAFSVRLPGVAGDAGGEVSIRAQPPKFFRQSLGILRLANRRNRTTEQFSELIYGFS